MKCNVIEIETNLVTLQWFRLEITKFKNLKMK